MQKHLSTRLIGCHSHVFYLFHEHVDYFYIIQLSFESMLKAIRFKANLKAPFLSIALFSLSRVGREDNKCFNECHRLK